MDETPEEHPTARRRRARRRALRAAQVVTLGLALAGCGESHEGGGEDAATPRDAAMADAGGEDAATPVDAAVADAGGEDAGSGCTVFPPETRECCEEEPGGFWDEETDMCLVAVPGPFVPPAFAAPRMV